MTTWLIDILPDWIFYLILCLGVLGVIASIILTFVPFVQKYRILIQVVSILLLVLGVWYAGAISNNNAWEQKVAELELKIAQSEKVSAELNLLLIESLVENQKQTTEINNINKKYLDSIRNKVDQQCKIGSEVINLHNSAAKNQIAK